jgi:hypothetical protein
MRRHEVKEYQKILGEYHLKVRTTTLYYIYLCYCYIELVSSTVPTNNFKKIKLDTTMKIQ